MNNWSIDFLIDVNIKLSKSAYHGALPWVGSLKTTLESQGSCGPPWCCPFGVGPQL